MAEDMNPDMDAMNPDQGAMNLDRSASPVLTPFSELSEAAQTELRESCLKQFQQLELLQDEILTFDETDVSGETLPSEADRQILTESELSMFLTSVPKLSSKNPEILLEAQKVEMQKQCAQLETVLSFNKAKRDELLKTLEWEQKLLEEKTEVFKAVVAHTEQMRMERESRSTENHIQNLKDKVKKLKDYHTKLLDIVVDLVEEHFPLPDDEEDLLPLSTILEELINKALGSTHDPYVTIDERFWPAYIETLLRHGIAVRHPEDNFKIRLESF